MRTSKLYAPTLRQTPAEAEVVSHQLMLRAGMIRKAAGGIYTYLPLAWKVLKKIKAIIREEMDNIDGQEISMPIIQPSEMWKETGRWEVYGDEMFRLNDRHNREFCLGPTHEEMVTTLIRDEVRSYKQLPLRLYQIQNKYRDEIRPRFGLMRGREFIMKDMYSFDKDEDGVNKSYQLAFDAYTKIFTRCGLKFRPVEADNGAIGGGHSHEFTVLASAGESEIAYCTECNYAASNEKAELKTINSPKEDPLPLKKVSTPNAKTIEAVAEHLNTPIEKTIKAVAYKTEKNELILSFVRGDHEVNDVKVQNKIDAIELTMADDDLIKTAGSVPGYISPLGLNPDIKVIIDSTVMEMHNAVAGANEIDMHYINVNPKRDFQNILVADIRIIKEGDPCPKCNAPVKMTRGIEAGQVFTLGTKYSKSLNATFLDENGKERTLIMGCYGIGVSRTMAAAIEQNNDKDGIIWPRAIAPFEVVVVPINSKDDKQSELAEEIYTNLKNQNIDVIIDDRKERAGVKFKDADLIGYPIRITIGPKAIDEDIIEVKIRKTGEILTYQKENYLNNIIDLLKIL